MNCFVKYEDKSIKLRFSAKNMFVALENTNVKLETMGEGLNMMKFMLEYVRLSLPEGFPDDVEIQDVLSEEDAALVSQTAMKSIQNNTGFFSLTVQDSPKTVKQAKK